MLVPVYKCTRCRISYESYLHKHLCKNLRHFFVISWKHYCSELLKFILQTENLMQNKWSCHLDVFIKDAQFHWTLPLEVSAAAAMHRLFFTVHIRCTSLTVGSTKLLFLSNKYKRKPWQARVLHKPQGKQVSKGKTKTRRKEDWITSLVQEMHGRKEA